MKKLLTVVFAMLLALAVSSGSPPAGAQEEGEGDTCDEVTALANKVCVEAQEGVEEYANGDITKDELDQLIFRCRAMRLAEDTCPGDPD